MKRQRQFLEAIVKVRKDFEEVRTALNKGEID